MERESKAMMSAATAETVTPGEPGEEVKGDLQPQDQIPEPPKPKPRPGGLGDISSLFASKDAKKKRLRQQKMYAEQMKEKSKPLRKTDDELGGLTLELGLLLDCTSSMKSWMDRAKETLNEIIANVQTECQEEGEVKVRVCFVGYRDHGDTERFCLKPFSDDIEAVKKYINELPAEGGADVPEDVAGGLKLLLMQDWTTESSKKVFLIADAPAHGKKYHSGLADDYPGGSPDGL